MSIRDIHKPANIPQLIEHKTLTILMYSVWVNRIDLQDSYNIYTYNGQLDYYNWFKKEFEAEYIRNMLHKQDYMILKIIKKIFKFIYNIAKNKIIIKKKQEKIEYGVNLIGYTFAESGVGEHVRMSAKSFSKTNIKYGLINFDYGVVSRKMATLGNGKIQKSNKYNINIFCINADQMINAYSKLGEEFFSNRLNISYPFWELSKFPIEWTYILKAMDEVWAPTKFIQDSLISALNNNVIHMPIAVEIPIVPKRTRFKLGILEDYFTFLVSFDFLSYIHRKNPWASIKAFNKAFSNGTEKVSLVIKVMNEDENSSDWKLLQDLATLDKRIIIINKVMNKLDLLSLVSECDCYVSLHRAEGLGIGPMEAMLLGKPTILTDYSGTKDYANKMNSCLVKYSLIPVEKGQYVYYYNQVWADPDIDHAAYYMKKLANDLDYSDRIGNNAKKYITENFNSFKIGSIYSQRLNKLIL